MTSPRRPRRGDVWFTALDPAPPRRGHEQANPRPVLIISVNTFNSGPADLVVVCPITSTNRGNPLHIPLGPPEGGTNMPSVILCDQITTLSLERLQHRLGSVNPATLQEIGRRLRIVLGV
jgi:mRNA interferase MazF